MTDIDYAERVQRGIALLDKKWPAWAQEIDLDRLDIQSDTNCVTAQFAGRSGQRAWYLNGQRSLDLDDAAYDEHGFNAQLGWAPPEAYEALNGLWKAAILARRAGVQPEASER